MTGDEPKVWAVLDANGGPEALYGVFTTRDLAESHMAGLGQSPDSSADFYVEEAELLSEPMWEAAK